jgi:hypothetical protein
VVDAITIRAILNYRHLTKGVEKMDTINTKKILDFTKLTGLTERITMSHGTLYVTLHQPERCDFFHGIIRTFYKDNINTDGGVNMYAVGDEFAFDFVPEDRETPVFTDEKDNHKGVDMEALTDDITEDAMNDMPSEVDIALNLEADSKEGR